MSILSWFSKKSSNEDYEQVLASLALSIQKRQTQLSEIRLRERRAQQRFTLWGFAAWVVYVGLWWWGGLAGGRGRAYNVLWTAPVSLGLPVVLLARRIVRLWYTRKGNAEEKTLQQLLVQQRNKIEEIKKKTNYYSTKNLLDRYDESASGSKISAVSGIQSRDKTGPVQSQIKPRSPPNKSTTSRQAPLPPQTPVRGGPQGQPLSPTFVPLPPPRKQWYDKLADAILGDDTATSGPPPSSRYALICERCFSHNGLVKEEQWEDAQYLCPKCGYFNKSARSRKAGLTSPTSPQSAVSPSSVPPPQSAMSLELPSASAGPSVSQVISRDTLPSERSDGHQLLSSPPSRDHGSMRSSLSGSAVFIDKLDTENQETGTVGYVVGETEDKQGGQAEQAEQMDVDS